MKKQTEPPRLGFPSTGASWFRSRGQGRCGMALVLAVIIIMSLGAGQARAQTAQLYWQCVAPSSTSPQGGYCPAGTTYPLPVTGVAGGTALTIVAGTQTALSIATATALTIPATATVALIQAQGTNNAGGVCLYWRDDGTNPTASVGQQLAAQASIYYKVTSLPIKMIVATGATCAATISYYK